MKIIVERQTKLALIDEVFPEGYKTVALADLRRLINGVVYQGEHRQQNAEADRNHAHAQQRIANILEQQFQCVTQFVPHYMSSSTSDCYSWRNASPGSIAIIFLAGK